MMKRNFLDSVDAVLSVHGENLQSLIGQRLQSVQVAWDVEQDEWFSDEPVVLVFERCVLEIVWWQLNELSISWGAIDRERAPNWFGCYKDSKLQWREANHAAVVAAIGRVVEEVDLVELNESTLTKGRSDSLKSSDWLLHGVCIGFETESETALSVFNALDENGLSNDVYETDGYRKTPVG